jgi:hypothetical protein
MARPVAIGGDTAGAAQAAAQARAEPGPHVSHSPLLLGVHAFYSWVELNEWRRRTTGGRQALEM